MKKKFNTIIAFCLASSLLSGCALRDFTSKEATEYINDELAELASTEASSSDVADEIIILRDLFEPLLEESSASASTSTISKNDDSASEASSEEKESESEKDEDRINMVFFGDSQMANGRSDGTDIPSLVAERVPGAVAYNFGIGGTTAALERTTANYRDYDNWTSNCFIGMVYAFEEKVNRANVLSRYPEIQESMSKIDPEDVDYYFIEYGANDFFNKSPLDKTQTDLDEIYTFYGALCLGIDELKRISPDAKIVLMTPFYGIYKDADGAIIGDAYIVSNGIDTLANYARKTGNVWETEEVFDFDGMFQSHADLYMDQADQYLIDGIHLSLTGRQIFARLLAHIPNWAEGFEPYAYLETDNIKIAEFNPDEYYRYRDDMLEEYYPDNYERMMNGEYLLAQPQNQESESSDSN